MGSIERRSQLSDPTQYAIGTIVIPAMLLKDPFPFYVNIVDEEKYYAREPLVPYLVWDASPAGATTENGVTFAWTLCLAGLEGEYHQRNPLGYAYDNDPEGLRSLVCLLEDKDALYSLATLVAPDMMAEATQGLAIFKIFNKYEKGLFLDSYHVLRKRLQRVFRSEIFDINTTEIQEEHIVYSFSLAPLFWKGVFPAVTQRGQRRNKVKGLRKILRKTKLNLIEEPLGINTQNVSLTALSLEDWNEMVKILGVNPIRAYVPDDVEYLDPKLFKKSRGLR